MPYRSSFFFSLLYLVVNLSQFSFSLLMLTDDSIPPKKIKNAIIVGKENTVNPFHINSTEIQIHEIPLIDR